MMILSDIGFHSIRLLWSFGLSNIPTLLSCLLLMGLPEYSRIPPCGIRCSPEPFHRVSLKPRISMWYAFLSLSIWASFVVSIIVFTFQHPILVRVFKLKVVTVVSARLSFMRVSVICCFKVCGWLTPSARVWWRLQSVASRQAWPSAGGTAFPLSLMLRLYRQCSVARASFVDTGCTVVRWGWHLVKLTLTPQVCMDAFPKLYLECDLFTVLTLVCVIE